MSPLRKGYRNSAVCIPAMGIMRERIQIRVGNEVVVIIWGWGNRKKNDYRGAWVDKPGSAGAYSRGDFAAFAQCAKNGECGGDADLHDSGP